VPWPTIRNALVTRLRAIPDGEISDTARRAGLSLRALMRIREGHGDVKLSTLVALARALEVHPAQLLGGSAPRRRPAPIGRRHGRPRGIRREPDVLQVPAHDEDDVEPES
jgi:transcriptional regulator with XRE-family HTH domain